MRTSLAECDEHEPIDRHETTDTARARHETRHIEVFDAGAYFHDTEWAPFIAAVIRVQRRRLVRDTATGLWNLASETSYHVSNAVFSAHAAGGAIRAHWGIENRHHYPRDVTMGEDACRVRKNPGILARIRSFAANIMRANNVANMTDARYRNAIGGLDRLFSYHTKQLWKSLKRTMTSFSSRTSDDGYYLLGKEIFKTNEGYDHY